MAPEHCVRTLTIFLCCFFFALSPAHAWNATGHKMIAEIAFDQLDAELQLRVVSVLQQHPRFAEDFTAAMPDEIKGGPDEKRNLWIFKRASIWPDIVPGQGELARDEYHRGTWHYINLAVFLTPEDKNDLRGKLEQNTSLQFDPPLARGLNIVQALQGNLAVWRDAAASEADKAVALCWILHLTGDLHQPLHTVALFSRAYFPVGDRGGNSIRIEQEPKPTNLHAVWDDLPNDFADQLSTLSPIALPANEDVTLASLEKWLQRHAQLASEFVYTDSLKNDLVVGLEADGNAAMTLSNDYRSNARDLAQKQVTAAGHRIAALLSN
jgi:hypothetical protein